MYAALFHRSDSNLWHYNRFPAIKLQDKAWGKRFEEAILTYNRPTDWQQNMYDSRRGNNVTIAAPLLEQLLLPFR
jgi:hypothetical protein